MANYEGYKVLLIDRMPEKKVIVITHNEPEHHNPSTPAYHHEMWRAVAEVEEDDGVNVVVLTGAGNTFSSGGDVKRFLRARTGEELPEEKQHRRFGGMRTAGMGHMGNYRSETLDCMKPVIAAVNGDAIGAGSNRALMCDIVIMAEDARIGDYHARMGLVAGDGGVVYPLQIGLNKAKELIMTGDLLTGKEAERIGLINHAVPRDQVLPTAIALAERLAKGAIQAISWNKFVLNKIARMYMEWTMDLAMSLESHNFTRDQDHLEAAKAFLEKRAPKFQSKFLDMN